MNLSPATAMHEHPNEGQPELQHQQYQPPEDQMMMDETENDQFFESGREGLLDDDILDLETVFTRAGEFPSLPDFGCHSSSSSSPSLLPLVRSNTFSPVGPSSSTASTQSDASWVRQALVSTGTTEICEDGVGQSDLKAVFTELGAEIDSRLDAANECGLDCGEQREEHVGGYMIMNEGEHKGDEEHSTIFYNWLRANKDVITAAEFRRIKMNTETIECAMRRLRGDKQGMGRFLKQVLEWVAEYPLRNNKKQRNPTPSVSLAQCDPQQQPCVPQSAGINDLRSYGYNSCESEFSTQVKQAALLPWGWPLGTCQLSTTLTHLAFLDQNTQPITAPVPPPSVIVPQTHSTPFTPPAHPSSSQVCPTLSQSSHQMVTLAPLALPIESRHQTLTLAPLLPTTGDQTVRLAPASADQIVRLGRTRSNRIVRLVPASSDEIRRLNQIRSSVTKEARKNRMARQKRVSAHTQSHDRQQQQQKDAARLANGNNWVNPNQNPNWLCFSSKEIGSASNPTPPPPHAGGKTNQPSQPQVGKPGSIQMNLKFLLQKVLKQSDVGSLGRIVLPKREAESFLPGLDSRDGLTIAMEDLGSCRVFHMRYRFWPNNKSRMYLLENTGEFVRVNRLQEGDFIVIYSDIKYGKYLIRGVKVGAHATIPEIIKQGKTPTDVYVSPAAASASNKQTQALHD